jgi:drug/metabolite transporter (DMT)-like permease
VTDKKPAIGLAMVLTSGVLFAVNGTVAKLVLRSGLDAPQLTLLRAGGRSPGCCS